MGSATIRTPDQRLRVFVSSTLNELADEREAARNAIEALHLTPVMFELGARPHPARALYRAYLDQSHVFLGIYWERYGWVAPDEEVSGLEDEYLLSAGLPRLVYTKRPAPDREPRLDGLIERIQAEDTVASKPFTSRDEIQRLIAEDLASLLSERFLEPDADVAPDSTSWGVRLPQPLSAIVGREDELDELVSMVADPAVRLVTLRGPGGIGKTRLGLELARSVCGTFEDGAVMVRLDGSAPRTEADVLPSIAAAMGVTIEASADVGDVLVAAMGPRRVLLFLDNFEQVLGASSDAGALLERCPNITMIVTSRAPLRLRAEHDFLVQPLAVPQLDDPDAERTAAVRLFVERARSVREDFVLDAQNRDAVLELCRRLEGIPLALELAAARVRILIPEALVARLDARLDILGARGADVPDRHRTLRATIEWSYELLTDEERRLFARLSVFEGGFTLEAAEHIGGADLDVLEVLSGLVEHSLVPPWASDAPAPRFGMFDLIRVFAKDRLDESGEADAVRRRHLDYFADMAIEGAAALRSPDFRAWMPRLVPEWPNLRAAWLYAIDAHDGARAVDLAECVFVYLWVLGRLREMLPLIDASLEQRDALDDGTRGRLLLGAALATYATGDYERARESLDEFDDLRAAVADDSLIGAALLYRAFLAADRWDMVEFQRCLDEAERVLRDAGEKWILGFCVATRGVLSYVGGDYEMSDRYHAAAVELALQSGNEVLALQALAFRVMVRLALDDLDGARELLAETIAYIDRYSYWEATAYAYETAAGVCAAAGDFERAARLIGAADMVRSTATSNVWPLVRSLRDSVVDRVREALGPDRLAALRVEGAGLGPPRAAALARGAVR